MRRLKLIPFSNLMGQDMIESMISWVVSPLRIGARRIAWATDQLKSLDRMIRKVLNRYGIPHPKINTGILYVLR